MKKIILLALILLQHNFIQAQKIKIEESSEDISGVSRAGLYTLVELDFKMIEKAWERKLKDFGKVSSSKGSYTVAADNIPSLTSKPSIIYSKLQSTSSGTKVWWAIDMGNSYAASASDHGAFKSAEKILHDFAAECYRSDINEQIKEAEKAFSSSTKNQEKEARHGEQLVRNVEKNKQEKLRLDEALKQNGLDLDQLHRDIESNKNSQTAAAAEVEKMKKAVEIVREKLNNIQ